MAVITHPILGQITRVEVKLKIGDGTITFDPPQPDLTETNGADFVLVDDGGNPLSPSEYPAFLAVADVETLVPDSPTLATSYQGQIFGLQVGPVAFQPTFTKNGGTIGVKVAVTVLYEGLTANQTAQSVVIVDW